MDHHHPSKQPSSVAREEGTDPHRKLKRASCGGAILTLAYQSLGVVYGDLSTSPLYVYKTTFSGKLSLHEDDEEVFGVLSFIFWTLTIIPLFKYIFFVLSADDNGEGGTFALYSLLCRHAKLSVLPNQQTIDESLSTYGTDKAVDTRHGHLLKEFFNKNPRSRNWLLTFVLFGSCMAIGDGVLTPTISVLSAVSGLRVKITHLHENYVVVLSCVILVGIFSLQHLGTHRVSFLFAPIVLLWLLCISSIGVYNIIRWNPRIFHALSPVYMVRFLQATGTEGWVSLGGVVLCITGAETMFADLGHFSPLSVKIAFTSLVYPCLVLAYMGEAAFLSRHHEDIQRSFYKAIPEVIFWPVFVVATLAAIVGSQAAISATFSLVSQCWALNCFPQVKIVHTSEQIYGQVYIPEVNWILMGLCLSITIGLRNAISIGHAYGIAVTAVMFVTTCLMSLVIIIIWKRRTSLAFLFVLIFGSVELLFMSSSITKIPRAGWIPLLFALICMGVMYTWNYGTLKKHEFDMENKVSMKRILTLGPSLGMVRVPGIGIVYADLVTGLPAIFGHFAMNLPAFHQVLVFTCVKSVQVPHVTEAERILVGRIGPKEYHIFRCIVRYGYKDTQQENYDFENRLVSRILEYIKMEESGDISMEGQLAEFRLSDADIPIVPNPSLDNTIHESDLQFAADYNFEKLPFDGQEIGCTILRDESEEILKAKESGVAYILGHSHAKAKKSSPILKKLAIDIIFSFLSKNCRGLETRLNVPHSSLLEVGMIYYV